MSYQYNAFISYRHAQLDSRIAAEVQTQLERMKIPKDVQQLTGSKSIDRIFRDKAELPLTSDLNDYIQDALNHSEYLIVICSQSTRESIWVQKEIAFFLKTHDKDHILTVIADGEPEKVIPEILRFKEMALPSDEGTVETVKVPIEPLSCDYRMPVKKARQEELPRLAAALLGCAYDDLRQRLRRYRQRRLRILGASAGTAVLALAIYFAWSGGQIKENYEQALINQSEYLASEALNLLNEGDRVSATLLALEALPEVEGDRPFVPEAHYALTQSVQAYRAPGNDGFDAINAFSHTGNVSQIKVSPSEERLYVYHSGDRLTLWNTEDFKKVSEMTVDSEYMEMLVLDEDLLVVCAHNIYRIAGNDGAILWQLDAKESQFYQTAAALNGETLAIATHEEIILIDSENGETEKAFALPAQEENTVSTQVRLMAGRSPWIAFSYGRLYHEKIFTLNTVTGVFSQAQEEYHSLLELDISEDHIVFAASMGSDEEYTMQLNDYELFGNGTSYIDAISPEDAAYLWRQQMAYPQMNRWVFLQSAKWGAAQGNTVPTVLCASGNICTIFDQKSGEVMARIEFPSPIVGMQAEEHRIRCVLDDGRLGLFTPEGTVATLPTFVDGIGYAAIGKDIFVVKSNSPSVFLYRWGQYDDEWQKLEQMGECADIQESLSTDRESIFLTNDAVVTVVNKDGVLYEQQLKGDAYHYDLLGVSGWFAYIWDGEESKLLKIDLDENKTQAVALYRGEDESARLYARPKWYDGKLLYQINGLQQACCVAFSPEDSSAQIYRYDKIETAVSDFLYNSEKREFLLWNEERMWTASGQNEQSDLGSGEHTGWQTELKDGPQVYWAKDGNTIAVTGMNAVQLLTAEGEPYAQIDCYGLKPLSLCLTEELLLVLYDDGTLSRYQREDGLFIGNTQVTCNDYVSNRGQESWNFTQDDVLALKVDEDLNLIDTKTWKRLAYVEQCYGYCPGENILWVPSRTEGRKLQMGSFHLYETEALIQKGKELVGNQTLSDTQLSQYGLTDR